MKRNVNLIRTDFNRFYAGAVDHIEELRVGNLLRAHLIELIRHQAHHKKRDERDQYERHEKLTVMISLVSASVIIVASVMIAVVVAIIRSLIIHIVFTLSKQSQPAP